MASRKKKSSPFKLFITYIILPLTLIDAYAFWRVDQSAQSWVTGIFSLSEPLSQLALILAINIAVIIILLIHIANK
jgi:hypothetical protein